MKKIRVSKSSGKRIDKFLSEKYRETPRRFFQNGIKEKFFLINEQDVSPSYKLKRGDQIKFDEKLLQTHAKESSLPLNAQPDPSIKFETIFENEDFAIIEKPAGLSVHISHKEKSKTLVNGLLEKYPQINNVGDDPTRPGIVHRLDKETSGLLILPLKQESFDLFKELFKSRQIEKKYIALCWGKLENQSGTIESFIGRSKTNPLKQSTSHDEKKISNPKKAITHFNLIKASNDMSLVELSPKTGRMHQIRVHLHSIGHPIVGDKKYATKLVKAKNSKFSRHLLHAAELSFVFKEKNYHFKSAPPRQFNQVGNKK